MPILTPVTQGPVAASSAANAATSATNAAASAANAAISAASVGSGVANGIATLDVNTEVVEPQAGAAAEVAAGRLTSVKQADGIWSALVSERPQSTTAQAIAGTDTTTDMSPARVKEAIIALDNQIYDLSTATADQVLNVGDKAVYNFAAATSIPLHIATVSGQKYRITFTAANVVATTSASPWLLPNNTTYASAFLGNRLYSDGVAAVGATSALSGILLSFGSARGIGIVDLDTTTTSKVYLMRGAMDTNVTNYAVLSGGVWNDSTTIWTSLGTVQANAGTETFDGNILVERIL